MMQISESHKNTGQNLYSQQDARGSDTLGRTSKSIRRSLSPREMVLVLYPIPVEKQCMTLPHHKKPRPTQSQRCARGNSNDSETGTIWSMSNTRSMHCTRWKQKFRMPILNTSSHQLENQTDQAQANTCRSCILSAYSGLQKLLYPLLATMMTNKQGREIFLQQRSFQQS